MKTSPSSLKVRQLITQTRESKLVPRPEFQRRLVWSSEDKIRFIDTILKGYPFPEIYVANGEVNVDTGEGQQLLVDGQQRVTTIVSYFLGDSTTSGAKIPAYAELEKADKEAFLNYDVAVRDLGSISTEEIIEVFRRINSTKYSLNEIEINNAVYSGELMRVAAGFAEHEFFDEHRVFRATDIKRMGDVRFVLQVIISMLAGYFNRDELFEEYLSVYNDSFPERYSIANRVLNVFSYMDECGFSSRSRIWKRSDLFTAMVEFDRLLFSKMAPAPSDALSQLERFFSRVEIEGLESASPSVSVYTKASIQASNDRVNRVRRGLIFQAVVTNNDPERNLTSHGYL